MKNYLNKYFVGELTSDDKLGFLTKVNSNEKLKEEFIETQNLLALIDWTFWGNRDEEVARQKLDDFLRMMEQRNNK